jgi:hypothetical protein
MQTSQIQDGVEWLIPQGEWFKLKAGGLPVANIL